MYKIAITKIEEKEVEKRDYQRIADTGNKQDNGPVYDYVTFKTREKVVTEVLSQVADNLNLNTVIKAINNIE